MLQCIRKFDIQMTQKELDKRSGGLVTVGKTYPVMMLEESEHEGEGIVIGIVDDVGDLYWIPINLVKICNIEGSQKSHKYSVNSNLNQRFSARAQTKVR